MVISRWRGFAVAFLRSFFYFQRGDILLYGDAVAHINIARACFDSHTPGLAATGNRLAATSPSVDDSVLGFELDVGSGVGGSIPSMVGVRFGCDREFSALFGIRCLRDADERTRSRSMSPHGSRL